MIKIKVNRSEVLIEKGLFENFSHHVLNLTEPCKAFILSDETVAKFYAGKLKKNLEKSGFKVSEFIIKPGEKSKTLSTAMKIYEKMASDFISRGDMIISIGGGIVSDIAGFAAATYLRGIKFVSIPTSLLAQIDASIGGKNGVNLSCGKNLVGTFYSPTLVLVDSNLLLTLPEKELRCGIAEAIKCGCIKDEKLFEIFENENFKDNLDEIIKRSITVKNQLTEKDEFDLGERKLLNFGHTFGHAYEMIGNFEIFSHGEAVAIGMNEITKISEKLGLTKAGTTQRLAEVLKKNSLPLSSSFAKKNVLKAILHDKKISGSFIDLSILKSIGSGFIHRVPCSKIEDFFNLKIKKESLFCAML